jgi:hypothetical protein
MHRKVFIYVFDCRTVKDKSSLIQSIIVTGFTKTEPIELTSKEMKVYQLLKNYGGDVRDSNLQNGVTRELGLSGYLELIDGLTKKKAIEQKIIGTTRYYTVARDRIVMQAR